MINPQELRLGNWVNNALSQPIQVEIENIKWAQDIYSIPLSPEILEKARFEFGIELQDFVKGKHRFIEKRFKFDAIFSDSGILYYGLHTKIQYITANYT